MALLSAAAALGGAYLAKKAQDKATSATLENAAIDRELQREFAQHGIRWKVDDAKAAGIHPLFAIGGSGASYTPSPVSIRASDALGSGLAAAGQHVDRAIAATQTRQERNVSDMNAKLDLERKTLENEEIRTRIRANRMRMGGQVGPAMPQNDPGRSPAAHPDADPNRGYTLNPQEIGASTPENPGMTAGVQSANSWSRTPSGGWMPYPNPRVIQEQDVSSPAYMVWYYQNVIKPFAYRGAHAPPPHVKLKPGHKWEFSMTKGYYQAPVRSKRNAEALRRFKSGEYWR